MTKREIERTAHKIAELEKKIQDPNLDVAEKHQAQQAIIDLSRFIDVEDMDKVDAEIIKILES